MQEMRFFNCLVKLGGDPVLMQSPRLHVSEDEVRVLKYLHGDDAISHLGAIGAEQIDRGTHLYQLARFYNDKKLIEDIFRVSLDNFESWLEESLIAEDQEREQRFQEAEIKSQSKRVASFTEVGALSPPKSLSRGADPGAGNTSGIAAAAAKLLETAEAEAAKGIDAGKKTTEPVAKKRETVE